MLVKKGIPCLTLCLFRSAARINLLPQSSHLCGLSNASSSGIFLLFIRFDAKPIKSIEWHHSVALSTLVGQCFEPTNSYLYVYSFCGRPDLQIEKIVHRNNRIWMAAPYHNRLNRNYILSTFCSFMRASIATYLHKIVCVFWSSYYSDRVFHTFHTWRWRTCY